MDVFTALESEFGDGHGGDVLVVDAFNSGFHAARKFGIEGQTALPSLGHFEVFVHEGGRLRSRQVTSLQEARVVVDDFGRAGEELDLLFLVAVDVLALQAVGVTHGGNDPHERQTASVEARTATEDILTVASEVPVEAQTGREVHTGLGHVGGGKAAHAVVAVGNGMVRSADLVAECIKQFLIPTFSKFLVVVVACDGRIVRQLDAQTE